MHGDQPPQIALTHPQEGQQFVFGLPVELRANAIDDVAIENVEFYVNDRFVGSDNTSLYNFIYETEKGSTLQQVYTAYAVAIDSKDKRTESQKVSFTLGQDEQKPVVNIVSPIVTGTEAGVNIAKVVEKTTTLIKVAGYDNVGVEQLILTGIAAVGNEYELTGNVEDVITGDEFSPQQIADNLNAFMAFKLITLDVSPGTYPVTITAIDSTGNQSTSKIHIVVIPDQAPVIENIQSKKSQVLPRDILELDVRAKDDVAIHSIQVDYYVDGSLLTTKIHDINSQPVPLVPAKNSQHTFKLALADHAISNQSHEILIKVKATDSSGVTSLIHEYDEVSVIPDNEGPLAAITSPVQNSNLYHGSEVTFSWRAVDASEISSIIFSVSGIEVYTVSNPVENTSGTFPLTIPSSGDQFIVNITSKDVFGNVETSNWQFSLLTDEPPQVSIRLPAPGTRYVEGELFTASALVTDNRGLASVEFYIDQNGVISSQHHFTANEIRTAEENGTYLIHSLRVPTRIEDTDARLYVKAIDNNGLSNVEYFELKKIDVEPYHEITIVDDEEPPLLVMLVPDSTLSVMPGERFNISGQGEDNYFLGNIVPVLVAPDGAETILQWEGGGPQKVDRVETETAPNPISFGELLVGERFYTDFEGTVILPVFFFDHVNETWQLKLQGSDYGPNIVETPSIPLNIQADKQKPVVDFISPDGSLIDRQSVKARINITDNVQLSDYIVHMVSENTIQMATDTGLTSTSETIEFDIDLSGFAPVPVPEHGKLIDLQVIVHDTAGN